MYELVRCCFNKSLCNMDLWEIKSESINCINNKKQSVIISYNTIKPLQRCNVKVLFCTIPRIQNTEMYFFPIILEFILSLLSFNIFDNNISWIARQKERGRTGFLGMMLWISNSRHIQHIHLRNPNTQTRMNTVFSYCPRANTHMWQTVLISCFKLLKNVQMFQFKMINLDHHLYTSTHNSLYITWLFIEGL